MKHCLDYIKEELNKTTKRPFLIAIDGKCGSGKSTLGKYLKEQLACSLIPMDDFFLQPHQRTKERLAAPGGNVDYERFKEEVLTQVNNPSGITYRPFRCKKQCLTDAVTLPYSDILIVEGSYSHHPYFENIFDLKLFLEISPEEQKKRILSRNGETGWPAFRDKWIPMENNYFEAFHIKENSKKIHFLSLSPYLTKICENIKI